MSDGPIFIGGAPAVGDAAGSDALKLRGADALERALAFVETHGDPLATLRARVALRAAAPDDLGDALESAQAEDGSFGPLAPGAAGWSGRLLREAGAGERLRGTLEALALLGDAQILHRPAAERAVRFVEKRQCTDGSFGDTAEELGARLTVTGVAAGLLARSLVARPEVVADAGEFLAAAWSPERVEDGHFGELVAYGVYHTNAPDELSDETLQWCGRELERGFRDHRYESLQVMQTLLVCHVGSLPGASFAPEELLTRLLEEQAADGGFDALCAEGPAARVGPSIDAMRAIIGLCAAF